MQNNNQSIHSISMHCTRIERQSISCWTWFIVVTVVKLYCRIGGKFIGVAYSIKCPSVSIKVIFPNRAIEREREREREREKMMEWSQLIAMCNLLIAHFDFRAHWPEWSDLFSLKIAQRDGFTIFIISWNGSIGRTMSNTKLHIQTDEIWNMTEQTKQQKNVFGMIAA